MHNPTGEPKEGDTRTYKNNQGNIVRQIYKCKHRVPGMETSILCNKNQHGCQDLRNLEQNCKRKDLIWATKIGGL